MTRVVGLFAVLAACGGGKGGPELRQRDCAGFEAMARRQSAAAIAAVRIDFRDPDEIAASLAVIRAQLEDTKDYWAAHTGPRLPYDCFVKAIGSYRGELYNLEAALDYGQEQDPDTRRSTAERWISMFEPAAIAPFVDCRALLERAGHCDRGAHP